MDNTIKCMIFDYNEFIVGKAKKFNSKYFSCCEREAERRAVALFSYVLRNILRWNINEVMKYANSDLFEKLGLTAAYSKLRFPEEMFPNKDRFYVAAFIFKNQKIFHPDKLTLLMYRNILTHKNYKFPTDYFVTGNGLYHARICFLYALNKTKVFEKKEDMYAFFANKHKASKWIKEMRLNVAQDAICPDSPIDFMYEMIPEELKDEDLLNIFKDKCKDCKAYFYGCDSQPPCNSCI